MYPKTNQKQLKFTKITKKSKFLEFLNFYVVKWSKLQRKNVKIRKNQDFHDMTQVRQSGCNTKTQKSQKCDKMVCNLRLKTHPN